MNDMLQHAYQHGYAVVAFEVDSLDFLEGIMQAAEQVRAPVILSMTESYFEYFNQSKSLEKELCLNHLIEFDPDKINPP